MAGDHEGGSLWTTQRALAIGQYRNAMNKYINNGRFRPKQLEWLLPGLSYGKPLWPTEGACVSTNNSGSMTIPKLQMPPFVKSVTPHQNRMNVTKPEWWTTCKQYFCLVWIESQFIGPHQVHSPACVLVQSFNCPTSVSWEGEAKLSLVMPQPAPRLTFLVISCRCWEAWGSNKALRHPAVRMP